jgi:RNA polymerase sigma factor (sigma-70 family)
MSELVLTIPPLPGGLLERFASDEQLARLVSRGHPRAFAVLYERHHQALFRYCRSIVRDGDDAQDALQSALMGALTALQAGERELAVRPWLFRIVHNEAISLLRRRSRAEPHVEQELPAELGIERTLEQRERLAALVTDLHSLAERQRSALVMRELAGLSIGEIAAALSTSPGAAKQALFEARSALHELAAGRAMACEGVRRTISERDGRLLRGRKIRAHLSACGDCRDFRSLIHTRSADLHALTPLLPASAFGAAVAKLLGAGAGVGSAGAALSGPAATLGGSVSASLGFKAVAGVALMAAATAGTVQLESADHRHRRASIAAAGGDAHHVTAVRSVPVSTDARMLASAPVSQPSGDARPRETQLSRTPEVRAPSLRSLPRRVHSRQLDRRPTLSTPPTTSTPTPVMVSNPVPSTSPSAPVPSPVPPPSPEHPVDVGAPSQPAPVPPVTPPYVPDPTPAPHRGHEHETHPAHPRGGSGDDGDEDSRSSSTSHDRP